MGVTVSIANIWMVIDDYQSIQRLIGKKSVAIFFCVQCHIANTAIAYFVGYVHGTFCSEYNSNLLNR